MTVHGTLAWPLRRAVSLYGDREALVDGRLRLSYRDWARRIDGLSGGLRRLGLAAGDVIATIGQNTYRHLECWLGIPAAAMVINDLNFRLAVSELEFIVKDCGAKAIVTDAKFLPVALALKAACPSLGYLVYADDGPAPDGAVPFDELTAATPLPANHPELLAITGDTLASISYTL